MISIEKNGARMVIDPIGAQMRAYRDSSGREWLWSGDPAVWKDVAPVLFPVIGQQKKGQITFGSKAYAIGKHGFARDLLFQVESQGEDSCSLLLRDTMETRRAFPFSFLLQITHRLLPGGFETHYQVKNAGEENMPFCIGGHPGLACPMGEGERFDDYEVVFEKAEQGKTLRPTSQGLMEEGPLADLGPDRRRVSLDYAVFDAIDTLVFPGVDSRYVDLRHRETGKGLRVRFDSSCLAIWTMSKAHAPYLCIEPWEGLPAFQEGSGRFEDQPYCVVLQPGKAFETGYRVESL